MFCSCRISTDKCLARSLCNSRATCIGWQCLEGPDASLYQISSKLVVHLRRYWDFSNFKNGHLRHVLFLKLQNFISCLSGDSREVSACQIRQNWSISCEGIKMFCFFKMAAATILDCQICEILMADTVRWAKTNLCTDHHCYLMTTKY